MRQKADRNKSNRSELFISNDKTDFLNNLTEKEFKNYYMDQAIRKIEKHGLDNNSPISLENHSPLYVFAETALAFLMKLSVVGIFVTILLNIINLFIQPENFLTFFAFSINFYVFVWVLSFSIKTALFLAGLTLFWNVQKYKRDDKIVTYFAEKIKKRLNDNNAVFLDEQYPLQIFAENSETGERTYSIFAKDAKTGEGKTISFEFEYENSNKAKGIFLINKDNNSAINSKQYIDRTFTEIFEK